jgi:hypothetical protein
MKIEQKSISYFLAGIFSTMIALYFSAIILFAPKFAQAGIVPICAASGNCGVCDIVNVFITLGKWLITGAGGLALLVIVIASVTLVISAGNPEKINSAKKQITGAIIGMIITMIAFQLVTTLLFIATSPSSSDTSSSDISGNGGLTNFLKTPWWSICDKNELIEKSEAPPDNSTAHCKFWGDGTPCNDSATQICLGSECLEVNNEKIRKQVESLNGDISKLTANATACGYLSAISRSFEEYKCEEISNCVSGKIEKGLCGQTQECCKPNLP